MLEIILRTSLVLNGVFVEARGHHALDLDGSLACDDYGYDSDSDFDEELDLSQSSSDQAFPPQEATRLEGDEANPEVSNVLTNKENCPGEASKVSSLTLQIIVDRCTYIRRRCRVPRSRSVH